MKIAPEMDSLKYCCIFHFSKKHTKHVKNYKYMLRGRRKAQIRILYIFARDMGHACQHVMPTASYVVNYPCLLT